MHTESRFNDAYPTGDVGGNAFPIPYHYEADELHAVWDKGIYTLRNNIARPFTATTYASFQTKTIDPYMATYKYALTDATVANTDCFAWSWESNDIATGKNAAHDIYEGVVENEVIQQSYIDEFVPVLENNITLGGYRLAYVTIYMYGDKAALEAFLQWSNLIYL
jgi:hypothetical protein